MGVDLSKRQARSPADHPATVEQLSQDAPPIKGTSYVNREGYLHCPCKAMVGRIGRVKSDDGQIDLKLDRPVEMDGKGNCTNLEQLFAAGYAACFIGALLRESETPGYRRMLQLTSTYPLPL